MASAGNREAGSSKRDSSSPHLVRLPGFINEENIGLGEVIKRTSMVFGIAPCGGCARRAAALSRWVEFTGRRS
jgi:hypothetical protein